MSSFLPFAGRKSTEMQSAPWNIWLKQDAKVCFSCIKSHTHILAPRRWGLPGPWAISLLWANVYCYPSCSQQQSQTWDLHREDKLMRGAWLKRNSPSDALARRVTAFSSAAMGSPLHAHKLRSQPEKSPEPTFTLETEQAAKHQHIDQITTSRHQPPAGRSLKTRYSGSWFIKHICSDVALQYTAWKVLPAIGKTVSVKHLTNKYP